MKKKLIKIADFLQGIRDFLLQTGTTLFAGVGFIFGGMSVMILIADKGQEIPHIVFLLFDVFRYWIFWTLLVAFFHLALVLIINNKKNWKK